MGPQWPNADEKHQRCQSSEQFVDFSRSDPNDLLSRLVTMDDTWLYHYDPETKQQSMEWRHSGSPRPKKIRVQKSAGKVLASILWNQDGTCNPEETGIPVLPTSSSPTLFSGSGPVGLPPVPWTEKELIGRHFSSDAEVIAAAETWLDGQPSEFLLSGLQI